MGELLDCARQPLGVLVAFGDDSPGPSGGDDCAKGNECAKACASDVVDRSNPVVRGEVFACWDQPCRQPRDGDQTDADEEHHTEHEPLAGTAAALDEGQLSKRAARPREAGPVGRTWKSPLSATAIRPPSNQQPARGKPTDDRDQPGDLHSTSSL